MSDTETAIEGTDVVAALVEEVGTWPDVQTGDHRFGGVEFRVGRREIGHVHPAPSGRSFADLPFPRAHRDELVAAGRARAHHVLPESGWVTVPIRTEDDLRDTIEIFRANYNRTSPAVGTQQPLDP